MGRGARAAVAWAVGLLVLGCSSGSSGWVEGAWGKEEEGFQAMLCSPRAAVALGEAVELHVRVRNGTGEVRDLASSHDLMLRISRGDKGAGDDVDYVTLAPEAIRLSPGQERTFLLRRYATAGREATFCKGKGSYRFRGKLGKLDLPPIEVRVE